MVLHALLLYADHQFADIDDIILSSVVPPLTPVFQELALRYCYKEAIVLDYSMDMGLQFLVDNPWEIGTDRIASALAAFHFYGGPAIIIAFSTATTFDVISSEGRFSRRSNLARPGDLRRGIEQRRIPPLRVDLTPPEPRAGQKHDRKHAIGHHFRARRPGTGFDSATAQRDPGDERPY